MDGFSEAEDQEEEEGRNNESYFILKLKEYNNLSEKAIQEVMDSTKMLLQAEIAKLKRVLEENLELGADLDAIFQQHNNLFENLKTLDQQRQSFERLGMIHPTCTVLKISNWPGNKCTLNSKTIAPT